jgi:hypothetical protein
MTMTNDPKTPPHGSAAVGVPTAAPKVVAATPKATATPKAQAGDHVTPAKGTIAAQLAQDPAARRTPAQPLPAARSALNPQIQPGAARVVSTKATMLGGPGAPQARPQAQHGDAFGRLHASAPSLPAELDGDEDGLNAIFFGQPQSGQHTPAPAAKHPAIDVFAMSGGVGVAAPSLAPPALPLAPPHDHAHHAPAPAGEFKPFQAPEQQGAASYPPGYGQPLQQQGYSLGGQQSSGHGAPPPGGPAPLWGTDEADLKPPIDNGVRNFFLAMAILFIGLCVVACLVFAVPRVWGWVRAHNPFHGPVVTQPTTPPPVLPAPTTPTPTPTVIPPAPVSGATETPLAHCSRMAASGGTVDNGALNQCCVVELSTIQPATSTSAHGVWRRVANQPAPDRYGRREPAVSKLCLDSNAGRVVWVQ